MIFVSVWNSYYLKCFCCGSIVKSALISYCFYRLYHRTKVTFAAGGEKFSVSGRTVNSAGFTVVMPWLAVADESLPPFSAGESIPMTDIELYQVGVLLKIVLQFTLDIDKHLMSRF